MLIMCALQNKIGVGKWKRYKHPDRRQEKHNMKRGLMDKATKMMCAGLENYFQRRRSCIETQRIYVLQYEQEKYIGHE